MLKSTSNAVNYVSDTLTWNPAAAEQQAKGSIHGQNSLSDCVCGAANAVSGNVYEGKFKGSAEGRV
ncbi:hypothetical protein FIBSPDRAFT_966527 [Athelia psychrophila]|uniref:Uncharacterized protein n=1 Tax=Athelia psychrophila TaxID=1759441 RepID=A0A167WQF0_9AGAM|nr:hypothetical protein FIBSPDRAFT_966527 [Fibularhizoctonia sp. CBS 109695]